MGNATTDSALGDTRRRRRIIVGLAALSMVTAACAGSDGSAAEPADPSPTAVSTAPPTGSTTVEVADTTPEATEPATRSTPPIPLGDDDRVFYAGVDTVVVADAPAPWELFSVSTLGMRRDLGTAEWVGISFWDPWAVASDPCQWIGSWETPGETVADLAEALVAVPGRQVTEPVPVTVGGFDGLYFEWSLPADLDIASCDQATTAAWSGAAAKTRKHDLPGLVDRIWILDIDGQRILIDVISLPVEQDIIRSRVDEVIDSLRFAATA